MVILTYDLVIASKKSQDIVAERLQVRIPLPEWALTQVLLQNLLFSWTRVEASAKITSFESDSAIIEIPTSATNTFKERFVCATEFQFPTLATNTFEDRFM
ncbi:21648_t:CDS:2 [Rhizophagus irregularis]|nr:21648_t:CDS:2 [Rhizophagus irregularis]